MAYSEEQKIRAKEKIIAGIVSGKSLIRILDGDSLLELPSEKTIFNWLNSKSPYFDAEFLQNYARAQTVRADREFEDILAIADDQEGDVYYDDDGNAITNHNVIRRAALRVDARKWRLARMQPKKYGDKVDLTSGDKPIGSVPVVLQDGRTYEDLKNDLTPE